MVFSSVLRGFCLKELPKLSRNQKTRSTKEAAKTLKGFFAVYKDKNVSMEDVTLAINLTLQDELGGHIEKATSKKLISGSYLGPRSRGVMVCYIGPSKHQSRFFKYSEKCYHVVIKLGVETETSCSVGKVIAEKSFDHVTKEIVDDALKNHLGRQKQIWAPRYELPKFVWFNEANHDDFKLILRQRPVEVELFEAVCTSYKPPFIELDLRTDGFFNVERFASDLGKNLNTCAHVFDLERTADSIFNLSNSLPSYKWYKKYIEEEITKNMDGVFEALREINVKYKVEIEREKEVIRKRLEDRNKRG